jgi:hypothetical protein
MSKYIQKVEKMQFSDFKVGKICNPNHKGCKIKEDTNNKRFPVRVTHFTDLEIRKLHLSTF